MLLLSTLARGLGVDFFKSPHLPAQAPQFGSDAKLLGQLASLTGSENEKVRSLFYHAARHISFSEIKKFNRTNMKTEN